LTFILRRNFKFRHFWNPGRCHMIRQVSSHGNRIKGASSAWHRRFYDWLNLVYCRYSSTAW